jgi:hypothetical protein
MTEPQLVAAAPQGECDPREGVERRGVGPETVDVDVEGRLGWHERSAVFNDRAREQKSSEPGPSAARATPQPSQTGTPQLSKTGTARQ